MGTSNFYNRNATKIFSFAERQDDSCPHCGSEDFEQVDVTDDGDEYLCASCLKHFDSPNINDPEMDYEDTRSNIYYALEAMCKEKGYSFHKNDEYNHDRNFGGRYICDIDMENRGYKNIGCSITMNCLSRSGYYDGANLDYDDITCTIGSYSDEEPDEQRIQWALEEEGWNVGMAKIHAPKILTWFENAKDKLIADVEEIYGQFTTPLIRLGGFSDGTSVYQRVNK